MKKGTIKSFIKNLMCLMLATSLILDTNTRYLFKNEGLFVYANDEIITDEQKIIIRKNMSEITAIMPGDEFGYVWCKFLEADIDGEYINVVQAYVDEVIKEPEYYWIKGSYMTEVYNGKASGLLFMVKEEYINEDESINKALAKEDCEFLLNVHAEVTHLMEQGLWKEAVLKTLDGERKTENEYLQVSVNLKNLNIECDKKDELQSYLDEQIIYNESYYWIENCSVVANNNGINYLYVRVKGEYVMEDGWIDKETAKSEQQIMLNYLDKEDVTGYLLYRLRNNIITWNDIYIEQFGISSDNKTELMSALYKELLSSEEYYWVSMISFELSDSATDKAVISTKAQYCVDSLLDKEKAREDYLTMVERVENEGFESVLKERLDLTIGTLSKGINKVVYVDDLIYACDVQKDSISAYIDVLSKSVEYCYLDYLQFGKYYNREAVSLNVNSYMDENGVIDKTQAIWDYYEANEYIELDYDMTFELEQKAIELIVKEESHLSVITNCDRVDDISWISTEPDIVAVDDTGGVIGLSEGTATIVASVYGRVAFCIVKVKPEILYGDANRDEAINSQDAVIMTKLLAGYTDINASEEACDVDMNGKLTSSDAVLLLKYLSGYSDVVLGK